MQPDLPPNAAKLAAKAIAEGDAKYGAETRYDGAPERHIDAATRHLARHARGEFTDHDSGLPALAHAAARILLAIEMTQGQGVEIGKRFPVERICTDKWETGPR